MTEDRSQQGAGGAGTIESPLPPRYRVITQVAVGGMGSIWAAEDEILRRRVAVKLLAEQFASQPLFVKRFEREARTAASLCGHPHVITIYDVGEHEGRPFIVMEYLPGGTLRDRLRSGRPEVSSAIGWLQDAAAALDYAHDRGVVHRDVKPQNLLLDDAGRLVIADLGIARAAYEDSLTVSGELLGTASYVSPEQAVGEPATAASDRYSLAVVAYELLTGTRPFEGASFAEQALQRVESEPERPSLRAPSLPAAVDAVVLRGLAKDPAARWERASEFVSALERALGEHAAAAAPAAVLPAAAPIDPERTWPHEAQVERSRRLPRRAVAGAGIVLLLAAVGVGVIASGGGGSQPDRSKGASANKGGGKRATAHKGDRSDRAARPPRSQPAPVVAGSGPQLNQQGYGLMNTGRYKEAIAVLRRAVAAFGNDSNDPTYAYALYNLGRSLRLAGRPAEAIPILERRMQISNQRGTVARELAAARRATGGSGGEGDE